MEASRSTCLHHSQQNSWRSNSFWQKESPVPYESIASLRRSCFHLLFSYSSSCFLWISLHRASDVLSDMFTMHKQADKDFTKTRGLSTVLTVKLSQFQARTCASHIDHRCFTQLALRQHIFGRFCHYRTAQETCAVKFAVFTDAHLHTCRPLVTYWTTTKLD